MEIKMSCSCGASTRITGGDGFAPSEAERWRERHAECSKLKYDSKTAIERGIRIRTLEERALNDVLKTMLPPKPTDPETLPPVDPPEALTGEVTA